MNLTTAKPNTNLHHQRLVEATRPDIIVDDTMGPHAHPTIEGSSSPRLTAVHWKSAISGTWNTARDWSTAKVPTASNAVTISVSGSYTVTVSAAATAGSLTINDKNAVVSDQANLSITTSLIVDAGSFSLSAGTAKAATLNTLSGSSLIITGGTLAVSGSGIVDGSLFIGGSGAALTLAAGVNFNAQGNANFGGSSNDQFALISGLGTLTTSLLTTLNDDGNYPALQLGSGLTWTNTGTVNASGGINLNQYGGDSASIINATGATFNLIGPDAFVAQAYSGTDSFLNEGTLNATTSTGSSDIGFAAALNNTGTIDVSSAASLVLDGGGSLGGTVDDSGLLQLAAGTFTIANSIAGSGALSINGVAGGTPLLIISGSSSTIAPSLALGATGTIELASGAGATVTGVADFGAGLVNVGSGTLTLTDGGALGAEVTGSGDLDLAGGSFTVASGFSAFATLALGGSASDIAALAVSADVAVDATALDIGSYSDVTLNSGASLTLFGSITFDNPNGAPIISGPGTLDTTGATTLNDDNTQFGSLYLGQGLNWTNSGTVDVAGAMFVNEYTGDSVTIYNTASGTFDFTSNNASLEQNYSGSDTFVNAGTIDSSAALAVGPIDAAIDSSGVITVTSNITFIDGGSLSGALEGQGTVQLGGGSFSVAGNLYGTAVIDITSFYANSTPTLLFNTTSATISNTTFLASGGAVQIASSDIATFSGQVYFADSTGSSLISGPGTLDTTGGVTGFNEGSYGGMSLGGGVTWVNSGDVDTSSNIYLNQFAGDGANIINTTSGDFQLYSEGGGLIQQYSGSDTFTNQGLFYENGGYVNDFQAVLINSGTFEVYDGTLLLQSTVTNSGQFLVEDYGLLNLATASFSNLSGGTLAGGTYLIESGGTLQLANNTTVSTLSATVTLNSAASAIQSLNTATNTLTKFSTTLSTITSSGTLNLVSHNFPITANGGTFTDNGLLYVGASMFTATNLVVGATGTIIGHGTLMSAVADNGIITASGGTLIVKGALSGVGTLTAATAAVLDLAGGGNFAGAVSGTGTIDIASILTLSAATSLSAASIVETANVKVAASTTVTEAAGATLSIDGTTGNTVTLSGQSSSTFSNQGTVDGTGNGTADIGVAFINAGDVNTNSGTLAFLAALTNNGTVDASTGLLTVAATVGGTGAMEIGSSGTLSLQLGSDTSQSVNFLASTGLLDLSAPNDFLGVIGNFGAGDKIDLINTPETSFTYTGGILTVKDNGVTEASLHFAGSYTQSEFQLTSDGHSGTFITFS